MRQPFSVNVFLYRQVAGSVEYLILHRKPIPNFALPSFWQGVTGGMEEGECMEETAKREVLEETGITLNNLTNTHFSYEFPIKDEWRKSYGDGLNVIVETVFMAEIDQDPVLSDEHTEFKWVSSEIAKTFLTYGHNAKAFSVVDHILSVNMKDSGGYSDNSTT
jgi:8-oxo-dGTP pyrophosphatase MutT (NUDIX family)